MSLFDRARTLAAETKPRLLLPEMWDARVVAAAGELATLGFEIVPVDMAADAAPYIPVLQAIKAGLSADKIAEYLEEPTMRAAAMLTRGEGDLLVSGAASETAKVIRAGLRAVGLSPKAPLVCSSFLMSFPDGRQFLWGDCGVNLSPNAEQMAHIGTLLADAAQGLFGHAELALLSYSTGESGSGESVDLVRTAAQALQDKGIKTTGPVQGDAALNPEIGARKGIPGLAPNTLIFPDLNAGNIAYKLAQELAGAQALGPLLHGFARPMADLSRGASAADIVNVTLIAWLMAQGA